MHGEPRPSRRLELSQRLETDDMKVLIAGGGIGGITAALCLAKQDIQVEVFEQASAFTEAGAGIQLSPNCSRVLHYLGLEHDLLDQGFLPEGTQFRDWKSGKVIAESALGEVASEKFGSPYYHIHRGDLLTLLINAANRSDLIFLHTDAQIGTYSEEDDCVGVTVNNTTSKGDALIGADGIHSQVRAALWGKEKPIFTGNIAWRAMVPTSALPEGMVLPMSSAWWGPRKHFVHYYVKGGAFVNCVCVVEKEGWEVESWTERGELKELQTDFGGWHNDIQTLIEAADQNTLYKWALYDRPPMSTWGRGRATLLGDACHPTLPFMAQGAAMAIEDGAVLSACLAQNSDIPAALKRYEDLRRVRTAGIQNGSRRNARLFHLSGIPAWLRNRAARKASSGAMDKLYGYNALAATQ